MFRSAIIAATFIGLASIGLSSPSHAGCVQEICVHGSDRGNIHSVRISAPRQPYMAFFRIQYTDGRLFMHVAGDKPFRMTVRSGHRYSYSVQACMFMGDIFPIPKFKCEGFSKFSFTAS